MPSFPLFLRQGRMQANIFLVKSRLLVDTQMLELLKAFHHYLFDNVLRLVKGGLVFVPDKAPVNVLIVPLRRGKVFFIFIKSTFIVGDRKILSFVRVVQSSEN